MTPCRKPVVSCRLDTMLSSSTIPPLKDSQLLSKEENLALRQKFIPKACSLHFEQSPVKVTRAYGQYLYDDAGFEILDCVNLVAHVGHCNPTVVEAGRQAMCQTGFISTDVSDAESEYVKKLKTTFPSEINTFLFVNSGSEANDLALQLARNYTGGLDVVAVDRAFHGSLSNVHDISHSFASRQASIGQKDKSVDWVHWIPCPDLYRGKYIESDPKAVQNYCSDAETIIQKTVAEGRKVACFISEPIMTSAGVIVPPIGWLNSVYESIRKVGGVCISDETQTGLGRNGNDWWGFLSHDVLPDIVTVGKPLGNGHPMALVACKRHIAEKLGAENLAHFQRLDSVASSIGLAVINTIRSENLMKNARDVGVFLREGLKSLAANHRCIGHVRGQGLLVAVEVVIDRDSRKPARDIAEKICYMMKEYNMVIGNEGIHKNVLLLIPPMCFTLENAHRVIMTLDKVLVNLEKTEIPEPIPGPSRMISHGVFDESHRRFTLENLDDEDDDDTDILPSTTKARNFFQELD